MTEFETDYLVVGAGASGLAFVDELVAHGESDVLMVDRRHRPGGHWRDAYPFVRLHQSSANYGVNSRPLGGTRIDTRGVNAGYYERAGVAEICAYYEQVLDDLLASGQVRFRGGADYVGDWSNRHEIVSRLTGERSTVTVRRRLVDTTYLDVRVPATHTPSFTVDPDARLIPVGALVDIAEPPGGFTVLGGGKTAMDACSWLLRHGVDPDRIRWVRPRESWIFDLASVQPLDLLPQTMQGMASWVESLAAAESVPDLFARLEGDGQLLRLDPDVPPTMFRGPILPRPEIEALQDIQRVVRHGRLRHLGARRLVFDGLEEPTDDAEVHVDCTAPGFRWAAPIPIFEPGRITLQSLIGGYTTQYAALVGYVEATRHDDVERNRLCQPVAQLTEPLDWVAMMRGFLRTAAVHAGEPDLVAWADRSRLSFSCGMSGQLDNPALLDALNRWTEAAEPALKNADTFLAAW